MMKKRTEVLERGPACSSSLRALPRALSTSSNCHQRPPKPDHCPTAAPFKVFGVGTIATFPQPPPNPLSLHSKYNQVSIPAAGTPLLTPLPPHFLLPTALPCPKCVNKGHTIEQSRVKSALYAQTSHATAGCIVQMMTISNLYTCSSKRHEGIAEISCYIFGVNMNVTRSQQQILNRLSKHCCACKCVGASVHIKFNEGVRRGIH